MSQVPSNDNKPAFNYAPYIAGARILCGLVAATWIGAKYPDLVTYLTANLPTIIPEVGAVVFFAYGVWTRTRRGMISATGKLPGAVVVLDSQTEANSHPGPGVVGPADPLPSKAA
ncbi:hypothetical protein LMIY3S_03721 [Labrys miyagiensis]